MAVEKQTEFLFHEYKRLLAANTQRRMNWLGLHVVDLADKMGTSHSQIYRILNGRSNISLETLCRLMAALELDNISELFK